jgi:hypothetical protein
MPELQKRFMNNLPEKARCTTVNKKKGASNKKVIFLKLAGPESYKSGSGTAYL